LGIGPGDEVLVPTLTFVATANAVRHCGAEPVFVDCEAETWNIDPALVAARITPRTKAIVVVHLYGHPVDMDPVIEIARRHGLFVIEDAAEAHGAEYKGRRVGSLGDVATYSFYANKILSTGEGGAVVTDDAALATRIRQLVGQGMDPQRRYWFPVVGYNYRMSNLAAAIGLAQIERIDWHLDCRLQIARWYRQRLEGVENLILPVVKPWAQHVYWMFNVVLTAGISATRDEVMAALRAAGIETRPIFPPLHTLPPYLSAATGRELPVAERIAANGITLPTWAGLREQDVARVCAALRAATARRV
jgi:perosamine synthetase